MKLEPAKLSELLALRHRISPSTLLNLQTWCSSGCIASWTQVMADALRHGWSVLDRKDGKRCWVYSAEWTSIRLSIRSECIGSMRAAENSIAARLVKRMGSEPLMREFETDAFA
eukprot:5738157-Amphidinium_carterae.1